jgi:hypothetical protein
MNPNSETQVFIRPIKTMKSSREGNCVRLTGGAEVTLQGDSTPVKNQLGGKRRGAGGKLNLARPPAQVLLPR